MYVTDIPRGLIEPTQLDRVFITRAPSAMGYKDRLGDFFRLVRIQLWRNATE
jgi:hypothetical protein